MKIINNDNMVVKRNDLIQKSRYHYTLMEQKAIEYLISLIQPNDSGEETYRFKYSQFKRIINWDVRQSNQKVRDMLQNLSDKSFWLYDSQNKNEGKLVRWFDIVTPHGNINSNESELEIRFSEAAKPYLFSLAKQRKENHIYITGYPLRNISLMKGEYSPRIYALLKSYANNKNWYLDIEEFKKIISGTDNAGNPVIPKSWSNFAILKRNVLEKSVQEINDYTDMTISYEVYKTTLLGSPTRNYSTIKFSMKEKTLSGKKTVSERINTAYGEKGFEAHQKSSDEYFAMMENNGHKEKFNNMEKNRSSYSSEFKHQIVDLHNKAGKGITELSKEYGVPKGTISTWVKALSPIRVSDTENISIKEYRTFKKKIEELEKEIAMLKKAIEILGNKSIDA